MSLHYYDKRPAGSLDEWLQIQRERRAANIPIGPNSLTPPQLADLLNYVLGLSRGEKIPAIVVGTWAQKAERRRAEAWGELQLVTAGIIPRRRHQHHSVSRPWMLDHWVEKKTARAA